MIDDLFDNDEDIGPLASAPLAERIRPTSLEDVFGQEHLTGPDGPLLAMARSGNAKSIVFWGPPGTGKTTIARLLADLFDLDYISISAIHSGVAELKKIFEEARSKARKHGRPVLLFVDEIHRFNKSQQDAFLPVLEEGSIVLVGATTENPSFELNGALLSRVRVLTLKQLTRQAMEQMLARTEELERPLPLTQEAREALIDGASGDGRFLIGQAEAVYDTPVGDDPINVERLERLLSARLSSHDRAGDAHYGLASAFQKAVRGSDPHAALYYAARLVQAGDHAFVFRRLAVYASEEVGMADPMALQTALAARTVYDRVGFPECGHALAQAIIHVATAPKSNSAHDAWGAAMALARKHPNASPPKRILNDVTKLMTDEGYKKGYIYDHDLPDAFSGQEFWPDDVPPTTLYEPRPRGLEAKIIERLEKWDGIRNARRSEEKSKSR